MTTVYDATTIDATDDGGGDNGLAWRHVISAAALSAGTGTQVQVVFRSGTSTAAAAATPCVTGAWIGQAASAGSRNFTGNQVQLKFGGSNTFDITSSNQNVTSDIATLGENFDNTKDYIVSFRFDNAATATTIFGTIVGGNSNANFLPGSTAGEEALTTASAGYTSQAGSGQFLPQLFITAAAGGRAIAVP